MVLVLLLLLLGRGGVPNPGAGDGSVRGVDCGVLALELCGVLLSGGVACGLLTLELCAVFCGNCSCHHAMHWPQNTLLHWSFAKVL